MIKIKDPSKKLSSAVPTLKSKSQKSRASKKCPIFYESTIDGKGVIQNVFVQPGVDGEKSLEDLYNQRVCELTGTENKELAEDIVKRAALAICDYDKFYEKSNIVLQSLAEQQPKDAHEARLCAQATALYSQGMDYLERARRVLFDDTMAKDHWHMILIKTATRLLDLHAKTVGELARYRKNGEQLIVVQHVNIENGGQAIVGGQMKAGGG